MRRRVLRLRLPRIDVHLRPINIPSIAVPSIPAALSVDSIVRSARSGSARPTPIGLERGRESHPPRRRTSITRSHPPKIIGRVPEPRFPDALLRSGRREGQVVVRFMVNERGSVDAASMIVEQSDHELFTSAVRDILPRFRFEPARTPAPESKPVAAWVIVPFRFTTKK